MQIELTGHGVDITPALREYVNDKVGRIVRHFEQLLSVHVVMHVDKLTHRVEANVNAAHKQFHAEEQAHDMYAAIDLMADKLDAQVRKHKEKVTDHRRAEALEQKTGT
ncbi:MAG: ribosome-associated translation inhibitor RaiA [Lysobacterales bacterium]